MALLKRLWTLFDDRTGISKLIGPFLSHPVPPGVGWGYIFGSGTLFAFIIQVVTGIALATAYIPSTSDAYQSLQFITNDAFLGHVLRGIHDISASAMVIFIGAHMMRTYLTGAYKFPREMNWLSGVLLFALTLGMGFTGQLLRWDQNAVWSTIVAAEQAGRFPFLGKFIAHFILAGDTVGGATLSRFFAFHVFFIPDLIFGILGFHLYLVLHNGISEPATPGHLVDPKTYRAWYDNLLKEKGVPFWPEFAWRDVIAAVGMITVVVLLAIIVGPPKLGNPPDPSIVQAYPRPDWYLLWVFALLALIPPGSENYVIVLAPTIAGLALILLPFIANKGERSPLRRPWAIGIVVGVVLMVGSLWYAGVKANWSPDFTAQPLPTQVIGASSGPIYEGAQLFYQKGCEYCHTISGHGGHRGPDLTTIGDRLSANELTTRILNGATNMPAFGDTIKPEELNALVTFLQSRKAKP
jgi:ubiquinol-cytochrome c reductase cytochrome b subunit